MLDSVKKVASLLRRPLRRSIEPRLKQMDKAADVHYQITMRLYSLRNMLSALEVSGNDRKLPMDRELYTCVRNMHFCSKVLLRIHLRGVNGNRDGDYWYDPIRAWRRREEGRDSIPEDERARLRVLLAFWTDEAGRLEEYDFLPKHGDVEFSGMEEMGVCYQKLLGRLWQNGEEIGWKGFEAERIELMKNKL